MVEYAYVGKPIASLNPSELDNVRDFRQQVNTIRTILNRHNILHNDITKSNLLMDTNGRLRVIDFEWANAERAPRRYYCRTLPRPGTHRHLSDYVQAHSCLQSV